MFTLWSSLRRRVLLHFHLLLHSVWVWLGRVHREERGSASEYAIIVALGVLLALGIFAVLGRVIFSYVTSIPEAPPAVPPGGGA